MKSTYHHGDLRNALVKEATTLLEEEGVEGVTLRGLARRLGVSHAAPGHHFDDREALLCEVAADGFVALWQGLEKALEEDDDVQLAAGTAYVDVALAHPERFKLMFASGFLGLDDCPPRLRDESSRAYLALLHVARGEVTDELDPETYRMEVPEFTTWALVHGATTLYLDGALGQVGGEEEFRELVVGMLKSVRLAT